MEEIVKHINDTNASFRQPNAGDAKNTDLFLDNEHYSLFKDSGEQITVRYFIINISYNFVFRGRFCKFPRYFLVRQF